MRKHIEFRANALDPTIIEDELGNPVFEYLSIWPQDVQLFVASLNVTQSLRNRIQELETELEYYKR